MRGDKCLWSHGPDLFVVDDNALEKMVRGTSISSVPSNLYDNYGGGINNPPPPGVDKLVTGRMSEG
jgi:hypothetical protein